MTSMQARRLTHEEIRNLGDLFAHEANGPAVGDLWQDRRPDFAAMYRPYLVGEPVYWGVFAGEELIGASGLLPVAVHCFGLSGETYLDTDLYTKPTHRGTLAAGLLMRQRFRDHISVFASRVSFFYGIEQNPRELEVCSRLGRKHGEYRFPFSTTLQQIFLTDLAAPMGHPIQVSKLCDVPQSIVAQWCAMLPRDFLAPVIEGESSFRRWAEHDGGAQAVWWQEDGQLLAGTILMTQTPARRFRLTGRPSLVIERLRKQRGERLAKDDEVRFVFTSLMVSQPEAATQMHGFFRSLVHYSREMGFHCLSVRHPLQPSLTGHSADQFNFERRIFVAIANSHISCRALHRHLDEDALHPALDSAYL